uniref:adenylate cyclase n=1 Tax=Romanomermis culicivorax TaxID=13658 RepID=A0A915L634_ROMCU
NTYWLVFFALTAAPLFLFVLYTAYKLWTNHRLPLALTHRLWRHVIGILLICLPIGASLANLICLLPAAATNEQTILAPATTAHHLIFMYILVAVLFSHCNFSQLSHATKILSLIFSSILLASLIFSCLCSCNEPFSDFLLKNYDVGVKAGGVRGGGGKIFQPSAFLSAQKGVERFLDENFSTNRTLYVENRKFLFHPAVLYGIKFFIACVFLYLMYFSDEKCEILLILLTSFILAVAINYQYEYNFRMCYFGDKNAYRTIQEMSNMKYQADWLLNNIIPHHIQDQLIKNSKYSENHEMAAVIFASIINWHEMYEETYEGGREFLRVLNELVADFDELLDRSEFAQVEKIKTIGTTYMAAAGLNANRRRLSVHPYSHLYELMEFALSLQEVLENFNKDLLNFEFKMKIGGVIGTTKLYYDIWGDTVNIASRMYSTGVVSRVQVSRKARDMLQDVYDFEYRDHIEVKGIDGGMEVYLLKNRRESMQPKNKDLTLQRDCNLLQQ